MRHAGAGLSPKEVEWDWAKPSLTLSLAPVNAPASIPNRVRQAINKLLERSEELQQRLAAALVSDFRDRFLPALSTGPLQIYQPDVADEELLRDVEEASIIIALDPLCQPTPRVAFYFHVPWDSEHGAEL